MKSQDYREWIKYSQEDLRVTASLFGVKSYHYICFHCQQCVEKILKAFLFYNGYKGEYKTHTLIDLLFLCSDYDRSFLKFKGECYVLTRYYVSTRYPEALPGTLAFGLPGRKEADEALEMARKVFGFAIKKMKE